MALWGRYRFVCASRGPLTAVSALRATPDDRKAALAPFAALSVVRELSHDADGGSGHVLQELGQLLGEAPSAGALGSSHALATRLRAAIEDGRIFFRTGWHRDASLKTIRVASDKVEWFPKAPVKAVFEKDTNWVALELRDKKGRPVPGAEYVIEFKAGGSQSGKLDDDGNAHVTDVPPGECTIWFPEYPKALPGDPPPEKQIVKVRLHDDGANPMSNVPYRARVGGSTVASGTSVTGWVVVALPADSCPESISIEWGPKASDGSFSYATQIFVDCGAGDDTAQARRKLNNLGYPVDDLDSAVRAFQTDYGVDEVGLAPDGTLPSATKGALDSLFDDACDATRPAPAEDEEVAETDDPDASSDTTGDGGCELPA